MRAAIGGGSSGAGPGCSSARIPWAVVMVVLVCAAMACAMQDHRPAADERTTAFFTTSAVPRIDLMLAPEAVASLRDDPRRPVAGTLVENGVPVADRVAVRLKGAAGSFREIDDRPAFTLHMRRLAGDDAPDFHGMVKFHLNNSVQDETLLHEALASDVFRRAGFIAPRVTHARVSLNGRDLGIYVLKEGVDARFARRVFGRSGADILDGGFLQDIDAELDSDAGNEEKARERLREVVDAALACDRDQRRAAVGERVDVAQLAGFMALERLLGHWDGYTQGTNNYRIAFRPEDDRLIMLPHGLDQILADDVPLTGASPSILGDLVLSDDEWRLLFRERLRALATYVDPPEGLLEMVRVRMERLAPAVASLGSEAAQQHTERVDDLRQRIVARAEQVRAALADAEPEPRADDRATSTPLEWHPSIEAGDPVVERVEGASPQLVILVGPTGYANASWRSDVTLSRGTYRFTGRVRQMQVRGADSDDGAGVRVEILGGRRTSAAMVLEDEGDDWREFALDWLVCDDRREVTIVLGLYSGLAADACCGVVRFDRASLRLARTGDAP